MKSPLLPVEEENRLAALHDYAVLDTPAEPAFDDLTRIAAHVLDVPTAMISLVDTDRQWFKSRYGHDAPEAPRDISFCGHVIESGARVVVPDALEDARFADNPLVTGHRRIRFYAGVPLRTPDGFVLGTLCAIDYSPRTPSAAQLAMLELLAKQVVDQLEARRTRHALSVNRDQAVAAAARSDAVFSVMADGVVVRMRRVRSCHRTAPLKRFSDSATNSCAASRRAIHAGARCARTARRFPAKTIRRCWRCAPEKCRETW